MKCEPVWEGLGRNFHCWTAKADSSDVLCDVEQQDHDEAVGWPGAEAVPDVERIVGEKLNVRGQVAVGVSSAGD